MPKIISYNFLVCEINTGTKENPIIAQITNPAEFICNTQKQFDANYPIAEKEAVPGTIEVTGEFDPEPDPQPAGDAVTWDEMDAAYQEGVDSV